MRNLYTRRRTATRTEMRFHVTVHWMTLGCYCTISDDTGAMNVCLLFRDEHEIASVVDALVVAANSKPKENENA